MDKIRQLILFITNLEAEPRREFRFILCQTVKRLKSYYFNYVLPYFSYIITYFLFNVNIYMLFIYYFMLFLIP